MAQFHFVEDYERLVAELVARYPLDEAMERAIGADVPGAFEAGGIDEREALVHAGLRDGHSLVDLGCGSGRLAIATAKTLRIDYLGIDIVQALLDYAASKSPPHYRFLLNRDLRLPAPAESADMVSAFSVFTHLLHVESYIYMKHAYRVLKPGGRLVFSFLEFANPEHWLVFDGSVEAQRRGTLPHLNQFIERIAIDVWADKLGFVREHFIDGGVAPWGGRALWQALAVLRKP